MTSRVCSPRGRPDPGPLREHEGGHTAVQTEAACNSGVQRTWRSWPTVPRSLQEPHLHPAACASAPPSLELRDHRTKVLASRQSGKDALNPPDGRHQQSAAPDPVRKAAREAGEEGTVLGTRRGSFRFHTHVFLCKHVFLTGPQRGGVY